MWVGQWVGCGVGGRLGLCVGTIDGQGRASGLTKAEELETLKFPPPPDDDEIK
jgi:hypothetical protein